MVVLVDVPAFESDHMTRMMQGHVSFTYAVALSTKTASARWALVWMLWAPVWMLWAPVWMLWASMWMLWASMRMLWACGVQHLKRRYSPAQTEWLTLPLITTPP
eukprot:4001001-Pyramimonas_sp.AAC.1